MPPTGYLNPVGGPALVVCNGLAMV